MFTKLVPLTGTTPLGLTIGDTGEGFRRNPKVPIPRYSGPNGTSGPVVDYKVSYIKNITDNECYLAGPGTGMWIHISLLGYGLNLSVRDTGSLPLKDFPPKLCKIPKMEYIDRPSKKSASMYWTRQLNHRKNNINRLKQGIEYKINQTIGYIDKGKTRYLTNE